MKDQRKRLRVNFETDVRLQTNDGTIIDARSADISMNGLFLETRQKIAIGSECKVNIIIQANSSKLIIETFGKIIRHKDSDTSGIGIEFVDDLEWWSLFSIYQHYGRR